MSEVTKDVQIENASQDDLRWFAETVLGLSTHPASKSATIIAKIREAGWDKPVIQVPIAAAPNPGQMTRPVAATPAERPVTSDRDGTNDPKVRIFVPKQSGPGGDRPISVGVNGTIILIPREQECDVAVRYVEVLRNAISTEYEQVEENGKQVLLSRDVLIHPFNIISGRELLAK